MITINFIFSIGFRCNSCDFLKKYDIRPVSGPFDYLFVDIETAFENICNGFENFLKDIVHVNKSKNINEIYYSNEIVCKKILDLSNDVRYMGHNYHDYDLLINQNFIDNNDSNLYDWKRILLFLHHDITNQEAYESIYKRIQRFKKIYNERCENVCLFYITRIIEINFEIYKEKIKNLKKKYKINCYIVIIFCSHNVQQECYLLEDNILFITKKVRSYKKQKIGTDNNNLNFNKEYITMIKAFNIELMSYKEIVNDFL